MQENAMDTDVVSGLTGVKTGGRLLVRFNLESVHNPTKSATAGRPIFDDVEYVEIRVPGDQTNRIHRPAREQDKADHSGAYAAFKAGRDTPTEGMPLKEWPGCTRGEVEMLAHFRIRTVEELASINDGNAQQVGPILGLRQKARDYIAAAKRAAPVDQMRAELAARDEQLAVLKQQVAELTKAAGRKNKE